jgi:hypothetical protein
MPVWLSSNGTTGLSTEDSRESKFQVPVWKGTFLQRKNISVHWGSVIGRFQCILVALKLYIALWTSWLDYTQDRDKRWPFVRAVTVFQIVVTCECRGAWCTPSVNMCSMCLQFALLENVLTSISDEFTVLRNHKLTFCVSTAVFCYVVGLSCVTYVSTSLCTLCITLRSCYRYLNLTLLDYRPIVWFSQWPAVMSVNINWFIVVIKMLPVFWDMRTEVVKFRGQKELSFVLIEHLGSHDNCLRQYCCNY